MSMPNEKNTTVIPIVDFTLEKWMISEARAKYPDMQLQGILELALTNLIKPADLDNLTVNEIQIILHASGLSSGSHQYRTHYCASPNHAELCKLVRDGYFTGPHESQLIAGNSAMFYLTQAGIDAAMKLSQRFNSWRCNCPERNEEEE